MLSRLACRVLEGDVNALFTLIDVGGARYPFWRRSLLVYVNSILESMGITSRIGEYGLAQELLDKIVERLMAEGEGRLFRLSTTRDATAVRRIAQTVLHRAVLALLDSYGISCYG